MTKSNQHREDRADEAPVHERRPADDDLPTGRGQQSRTESEADWHAQLAEDRASTVDADAPGQHPVGGTSSANSVSSDPFARNKSLGAPVPQVTRQI